MFGFIAGLFVGGLLASFAWWQVLVHGCNLCAEEARENGREEA